MLGLNLSLLFSRKHELTGLVNQRVLKNTPFTTAQTNLVDRKSLFHVVDQFRPEQIIHCAALANVDQCEKEPSLAKQTNTEMPGILAEACWKKGIGFLHVSTDAVFDGEKGNYKEEDQTNPLSVYASTKLEGEKLVLSANPQALVIRVNFYGFSISGTRSLGEFFLYNLLKKKKVKGFTDVHVCPLYVSHLAEIIQEMIDRKLYGLYHVVSPESLSKYDFGCRIANKFGLDASLIQPVSVKDGDLLAKRSPNLTLCVDKLLGTGIHIPGQEAGLDDFYRAYRQGFAEKIKSFAG